jgi:hypothetical protein
LTPGKPWLFYPRCRKQCRLDPAKTHMINQSYNLSPPAVGFPCLPRHGVFPGLNCWRTSFFSREVH